MHKMITKPLRITVVACLVFGAGGGLAIGAGKTGSATAQPQVLPLPVSLVDVMRASIEVPADGIWAAEGIEKPSEEEWQLADQDAVNLIAATTLVASAGTGKNDRKWIVNADWQKWVREMEKTALEIRADIKSQDQKKMSASADHLQEICEGCHTKYRPQSPSDGVSRYPFYPKRELPK
jgi:Cytochrome C'